MFKKYPIYTAAAVALVLGQHFLFSKLVILYASPDILGVFIAFLSVTLGQRTGTTYGFFTGLFLGILSGNVGLCALAGTFTGFAAGFFHVPGDSHATTAKKRRMLYFGTGTGLVAGSLVQTLLSNPLALPAYVRIPATTGLGTLMGMLVVVATYRLILKNLMTD